MKFNLEQYKINPSATALTALKKIDANAKGFLVVVDERDRVKGTLTDGDIRRAFIAGGKMESPVTEMYTREIKQLSTGSTLAEAVEIFKDSAIKFLPITDEEGCLVNVITKAQMHALLLQDIHADLSYDFGQLDDGVIDHEIFGRPWGFYKTTVMNDYFQSKVISVNPKGQLSLQSHNRREEHWIVAHGVGTAQIGESVLDIKRGSTLFIPKGCRHRLTNLSETEALIITEVQIGDYFGEDDIVRYEDIYGRDTEKSPEKKSRENG